MFIIIHTVGGNVMPSSLNIDSTVSLTTVGRSCLEFAVSMDPTVNDAKSG